MDRSSAGRGGTASNQRAVGSRAAGGADDANETGAVGHRWSGGGPCGCAHLPHKNMGLGMGATSTGDEHGAGRREDAALVRVQTVDVRGKDDQACGKKKQQRKDELRQR